MKRKYLLFRTTYETEPDKRYKISTSPCPSNMQQCFNGISISFTLQLFDYIAFSIFSFMSKRNLIQYRMPLGFTFSFPCRQEGLNSARLTSWTKGFKCTGVEGEDVVQLLREAIDRRDVTISLYRHISLRSFLC